MCTSNNPELSHMNICLLSYPTLAANGAPTRGFSWDPLEERCTGGREDARDARTPRDRNAPAPQQTSSTGPTWGPLEKLQCPWGPCRASLRGPLRRYYIYAPTNGLEPCTADPWGPPSGGPHMGRRPEKAKEGEIRDGMPAHPLWADVGCPRTEGQRCARCRPLCGGPMRDSLTYRKSADRGYRTPLVGLRRR